MAEYLTDEELEKLSNDIDGNKIPLDFALARRCSSLIATTDGDGIGLRQAERIIVHILNRWESLTDEMKCIWGDLAESVGYYPYIVKNGEYGTSTLAEQVRKQYHKSKYIKNIYLHSEQKKVSDIIFSGKNIVVSAPTSFGKSLLIEEIVASGKYKNIVVIQPTLALLDETRKKLKKYSDLYKIIVRTTQTPSENSKGNLFLLTAERVIEYANFPSIDFLIIDEFYKLSLNREDSVTKRNVSHDRVNALNNAFLRIYKSYSPQFYLLGPNIKGVSDSFKNKYRADFFKTEYSLVDNCVTDMTNSFNSVKGSKQQKNAKITSLFKLLSSTLIGKQTLVFCSSPSRCRDLAKQYSKYLDANKIRVSVKLSLCDWLKDNYPDWSLRNQLQHKIGIHDASLPKHIGSSIIRYFNDKKLDVIFCTSTIIEGVNTSAHNIVIFDDNKGGNKIDYFDYNNIKGRAGRLMEHYIGYIYNYINTPPVSLLQMDFPFIDQEKITQEILINIPQEDVVIKHKNEYNDIIQQIPSDLLPIIKRNGVSIKSQMKLYSIIEQKIANKNFNNFLWKNTPTRNQLEMILNTAKDCELLTMEGGVISYVWQLVNYLMNYSQKKDLSSIVTEIYNFKHNKDSNFEYDKAIEISFKIYRTWFHYSVPKAFRVIDSIQRYVFNKHGIEPGSYSYYVQELESDFLQNNTTILIEFGLPTSTIKKMEPYIPSDMPEEDVPQHVKNSSRIRQKMSKYELELFENL